MSEQAGVVVGVGARAGLGAALVRRFGREGLHVFLAGRTADRLEQSAKLVREAGGQATPIVVDTTQEADVIRLFDTVQEQGLPLEVVAYNVGNNRFGDLLEMEASFFEDVWRVCCLGGFLVGREAARRMLPQGRGSILFTGATASIRGRPPLSSYYRRRA